MAGFDLETQRSAQMPGMKVNGGRFDFTVGGTTVDVPTTLVNVMAGFAHADLTGVTDVQQTMFAYKVGDASACAVTFVRGGGNAGEAARMAYWLIGF